MAKLLIGVSAGFNTNRRGAAVLADRAISNETFGFGVHSRSGYPLRRPVCFSPQRPVTYRAQVGARARPQPDEVPHTRSLAIPKVPIIVASRRDGHVW
jgi:hypothetical protein